MDSGFRHEIKYPVRADQIPLLKSRVAPLMQPDAHAGTDGAYRIRSLYFDDYRNRCFYEKENGVDPREKFRIRIYDNSPERITLECKRKEHNMTQKLICPLTAEQVERILRGESLSDFPSLPPLLQKLELLRKTELYHPVIIVEYDRIPYVCRAGNTRVTFDCNLSSSADLSRFLSPGLSRRPVMPAGQHLMEVKYDTFLPEPIFHSLSLGQLNTTACSKYYLCRKFSTL